MSVFNKIKGLVFVENARTTVQAGEEIDLALDKSGRVVTYPYAVRGAVTTASSTVTRNDRTAIMEAVASRFTDVISITGVNTSTNAITVDIRSGYDAGIALTVVVPASSSAQYRFNPPLPASEAATPWVATASSVAADSGDSPVTLNMMAVNNL